MDRLPRLAMNGILAILTCFLIMASLIADTVTIGTPQGPNPPMCTAKQPLVAFDVSGPIAYTGKTATGKPSDNVFVEMFQWDIVKDVQIGANSVTSGSVPVAPMPPPGPWIVPLTAPSKGVGIKTY